MSLDKTPSSQRVHIGFFGIRNAGKSSVVNAVTNQQMSVVSDVLGTTTDPVSKAMELLPVGPVKIIDTPGFDDDGELGSLRVEKTKDILKLTDVAVLVVDITKGKTECDRELIALFSEKNIPYVVAYNKADLAGEASFIEENEIAVSAKENKNIDKLKEMIAQKAMRSTEEKHVIADLINKNELIVLVIPIDSAAPKGRLILPQQQTIRDILDSGACAVCVRDTEYPEFLKNLGKKPALVVCDSQVFKKVDEQTPTDIPLTSFSILFARLKGDLETVALGAGAIDKLSDGDKVVICEGCTHHRQCDDIGTVKLPNLIKKYTKKDISFEFTSGMDYIKDFTNVGLVIHCGGCMLNGREMKHRLKIARDNGIPITNYGIAIAYMNKILKRSLGIFPELKDLL